MRGRFAAWIAFASVLSIGAPSACALQSLEARDGVSLEAIASIKEPTRIRVEGAPITNVFGNIYSSNCSGGAASSSGPPAAVPGTAPSAGTSSAINPAGEVILECDPDKGEVYIRPVGGSGKPINLFVSTSHATYTLVLRRADTPADTIVLRDRTPRVVSSDTTGPAGRASSHQRALKTMFTSVASDSVPHDIRVEDVFRPLQLWKEARFVLTRLYEGRGLIVERYHLTNISAATMVLAEQEFDREGQGVLAVAIDNLNLRPGDSTSVYVFRHGAAR
jgi:conjugal transfer pilus assembly protein TraK